MNRRSADVNGRMSFDENGQLVWNFGRNVDQPVENDLTYCAWFLTSRFPSDAKEILTNYLTSKGYNGKH